MKYRVTLKKLVEGLWYARCPGAPRGLAETQAEERQEALDAMRQKIRYQLEWCPCSSVADDYVELEVREVRNHRDRLPPE